MERDIRYRTFVKHNIPSFLESFREFKKLLDKLVRYELEMYDYAPDEIEKMLYNESQVSETIIPELEKGTCKVIGAFFDSVMVGYVLVGLEHDDVVYIRNITVDDDYRSCGIGSTLLRMVESMRGDLPLEVSIVDKNTRAMNFYQTLGFKVIDTYEPYILLRK